MSKISDCEKVYFAFGSNYNDIRHRTRFDVISLWDDFAFHRKEFWVDRA